MNVSGHQRLVSRLRRISSKLPDVFDDGPAKQLLIRRMRARFMAEVDAYGSSWPALAKKTIYNKRWKGSSNPEKKLVDSGTLYRSFGEVSGSNAGLFTTSTGLGFRIGIDDDEAAFYGRIQHYGNYRIPARPFMDLAYNDVRSYREAVARLVKRMVREA